MLGLLLSLLYISNLSMQFECVLPCNSTLLLLPLLLIWQACFLPLIQITVSGGFSTSNQPKLWNITRNLTFSFFQQAFQCYIWPQGQLQSHTRAEIAHICQNLITALAPSYNLRFVQSDTEMKEAVEGDDVQFKVPKRSQWIRDTFFTHWNLVLQASNLQVIADCEAIILFLL